MRPSGCSGCARCHGIGLAPVASERLRCVRNAKEHTEQAEALHAMTRKELAVQFTSALIGAALATVITMTATASTYGEKISALEREVARKAEAGAVVELATKSDVRALGDMLRSKLELQDRRDCAQDDRIARVEAVAAESERVLRRVESKLDVLIAIADPDGRVGRTVSRRD